MNKLPTPCWTNPNFCPCNNRPPEIRPPHVPNAEVEIRIRFSCPNHMFDFRK